MGFVTKFGLKFAEILKHQRDMSSAGATDAPVDQSFTSISSDVSVLSWNILAECYFQEAREGGRSHSSFVTDKALIQWSQRLKVRHVVEVACPLRTAQTYPTTPAHCCGPDLASPPSAPSPHTIPTPRPLTNARRFPHQLAPPPSALRTRPQHHAPSPTRVASPTNSHRLPPLLRTPPTHLLLQRIVAVIMRSNADVVCLQEVMYTIFEDDLVPALSGLGYDGLMQNDSKRGDTHPQGVAIFWKRDTLSLSGECHRTRTMVAVLADSEDRRCAVVNCHLEGRPDKSVARVRQLQTTLAELVRKHPHHGLVVCGDFNCMLGSSACGAYLAFGAAAPGVLEWDHEVPEEVLAIAPHPYSLTSAYDFDPAAASKLSL